MASMLVALAVLLNFERMYMYLCMHDSTWCWWHSNKTKPPILEFGPYQELIKINDSLSTKSIQIIAVSLQSDVPQRLQSHCFVPCLTYSTAWCLCYITKDIETNHTTHTVHSTNIRITENPQWKKKQTSSPVWHSVCTSFSFIYIETSYKSINTYEWMSNTLQQYQIQEAFRSKL